MNIVLWEKLRTLEGKLDAALALLHSILEREKKMSKELDDLAAEVKANTDAEAAAVVLLGKLSDQIAANKTDPVALQKLSDDLKASKDSLAAAIVANTPAGTP